MNDDLNALRATERACLLKISLRAKKLRQADPTLAPAIARGKAIEQLPRCAERYMLARATLTQMGIRPLMFSDIE
jgi:hypothetical protein